MADFPIIDAQIHAWVPPSSAHPWSQRHVNLLPDHLLDTYRRGDHSAEAVLRMMDRVGVQVALLTSSYVNGTDASYVLDAASRHPGRFAVVAYVEPDQRGLDQCMAAIAAHEHGLGVRIFLSAPASMTASDGPARWEQLLRSAQEFGLPVFVSPMGRFEEVADLARRHRELLFVVDHLGLWADRPVRDRLDMAEAALRLSDLPNVAIKCTATQELSRERYPYRDVWTLLRRYVDSFGADRLLWGSDINQHLHALTYEQAVDFILLSDEFTSQERGLMLGGTAARLLHGCRSLLE